MTTLQDAREADLDELHALRRRLSERAGDPGVRRIIQAVDQLIDELRADTDGGEPGRPDSGASARV